MPGFNAIIGELPEIGIDESDTDFRTDVIRGENYRINRMSVYKFDEDKLFSSNEKYVIVLDGVILNKRSLKKEFGQEKWIDTIIALYESKGRTFFKLFRGRFSGLLYDKQDDEWIVFVDHLSSKNLYYTKLEKGVVISSDIRNIYNYFKKNDIDYSLSIQSAYMLLSYGFMLEDRTLCESIKRVRPGTYITYKKGELTTTTYYWLPQDNDDSLTDDEIVEEIDNLFREAIRLQFEKDREYDYMHLVPLSGGLDSRMTSWVADEMGYKNQLNFTFSQTDYLDAKIAKQIAADLKHEWIFKSLDNGIFLRNIDKVNQWTGGDLIYFGLAHFDSTLKYLNMENFGLIHTGQLGASILGSMVKSLHNENSFLGQGAISKKLLNKVDHNGITGKYANVEHFKIYQRGVNFTMNGLITHQQYTETAAPYCDWKLMDFMFKIPYRKRMNHVYFKKWINEKYPKAADYIWEGKKTKIKGFNASISFFGKEVIWKRVLTKLMETTGLKKEAMKTKHHMNPLDYWYEYNGSLRNYLDSYFKENIGYLVEEDKLLRDDAAKLYREGNTTEKIQVLTLLSAVKLFFR